VQRANRIEACVSIPLRAPKQPEVLRVRPRTPKTQCFAPVMGKASSSQQGVRRAQFEPCFASAAIAGCASAIRHRLEKHRKPRAGLSWGGVANRATKRGNRRERSHGAVTARHSRRPSYATIGRRLRKARRGQVAQRLSQFSPRRAAATSFKRTFSALDIDDRAQFMRIQLGGCAIRNCHIRGAVLQALQHHRLASASHPSRRIEAGIEPVARRPTYCLARTRRDNSAPLKRQGCVAKIVAQHIARIRGLARIARQINTLTASKGRTTFDNLEPIGGTTGRTVHCSGGSRARSVRQDGLTFLGAPI